ncbi:MAG: prolipoprotein diacylglyceryl transferase [Campylobacterales bacterium]
MEKWNYIYNNFDPVAFEIFGFPVHWYGLMYVLALLSAMWFAMHIVKKDRLGIEKPVLEAYFLWVEIGVIVGARLGYILFYDPNTLYYLTRPWQMFNPFVGGEFVGIRGMSYHGAFIGFFLSTWGFAKFKNVSFLNLLDIVGISVPLGYVFGRIGNFLNQELIGRATDLDIGIYVAGIKRHPSQLYEAVLEGVLLFFIIYWYRTRATFAGELAAIYGVGYSLTRFIAEFYRAPDSHLGFIALGLSMGQLLSLLMGAISLGLYFYWKKLAKPSMWAKTSTKI